MTDHTVDGSVIAQKCMTSFSAPIRGAMTNVKYNKAVDDCAKQLLNISMATGDDAVRASGEEIAQLLAPPRVECRAFRGSFTVHPGDFVSHRQKK